MGKISGHWRQIFVLVLAVANLLVWTIVWRGENRVATVSFLNVGQGDSIFITVTNGNQVLIDGGPDDSVLRELGKLMPFYDRTIDLIILTHPHVDHLAGLISVLKRYQVGAVLESEVSYPSSAEYAEWQKLLAEKQIKVIRAARGEQVALDDETKISVLAPLSNFSGRKLSNVHDSMVVTKLSAKFFTVLLAGDMERKLETQLVAAAGDSPVAALKSEILKVGHHGSKTGTGEPFLRAVAPRVAVISVGVGNSYHLPATTTVNRLKNFGAQIWRTDEREATISLALP